MTMTTTLMTRLVRDAVKHHAITTGNPQPRYGWAVATLQDDANDCEPNIIIHECQRPRDRKRFAKKLRKAYYSMPAHQRGDYKLFFVPSMMAVEPSEVMRRLKR